MAVVVLDPFAVAYCFCTLVAAGKFAARAPSHAGKPCLDTSGKFGGDGYGKIPQLMARQALDHAPKPRLQ